MESGGRIGILVGAILWGYIGDKYSKKMVLNINLSCLFLLVLLLGFSVNYEMALSARFAIGLFTGIAPNLKGYISDVSDDSNISKYYIFYGVPWGISYIIGPIIGSNLLAPHKQYPSVFGA
mmetsp:Transcript_9497/g.1416  ORF Transcript_9497/g.1416 Transcript_9497/m.1416 type:complete len:121 (-) Transcript_9497:159-521(-)